MSAQRPEGTGAAGPGTSSARQRTAALPWILAAIPVLLGVVIAVILAALGDARRLQIGIDLPAVPVIAGAVLTAVALGVAGVAAAGRRRRRRADAAVVAAQSAGAQQERENHRRFLARLDHELKNPLTAIRAVSAAAQGGAAPADAWPVVDAQAAKLSGLVRDLRKLAELETRPLETERIELAAMLEEAVAALGQQDPVAAARIALTVVRVPWPVPPIAVDPDLIALAIDNVLGNAAKYSVDGPIEVRLREDSGWAVIEVADAGRGVPEADLPLVFDELARAGNARDVAGSGIGLTLVSTVLRRHGGDVSFRSAEGSGSLVVLRLPLV